MNLPVSPKPVKDARIGYLYAEVLLQQAREHEGREPNPSPYAYGFGSLKAKFACLVDEVSTLVRELEARRSSITKISIALAPVKKRLASIKRTAAEAVLRGYRQELAEGDAEHVPGEVRP